MIMSILYSNNTFFCFRTTNLKLVMVSIYLNNLKYISVYKIHSFWGIVSFAFPLE